MLLIVILTEEGKKIMKVKTIFNWINADWKRVKNHCRTTDNKEFTENEATETFKKKL